MKYLILAISLLLSFNVSAQTRVDLSGVNNPSTSTNKANDAVDYAAEDQSNYKGRNQNRKQQLDNVSIKNNSTFSRTISLTAAAKSAQLENLESSSGEFVQKVEDDRVKLSKDQENLYNEARDLVVQAYKETQKIDMANLGNEQDPKVTNAFKCKNLEVCNKNTDVRVIKNCGNNEMLHWSGQAWSCISLFDTPSSPKCGADQYLKTISSKEKACVDYIYQWTRTSYTACNSKAMKDEVYTCQRKQSLSDKGTTVANSKCLGDKPASKSSLCMTSWSTGNWSGCSRSCNGGTQTRSVYCQKNYVCLDKKPASRRSCNTHQCTTHWRTGSWSSCPSNGGRQYRSVSCPSGYACVGTKPSTSKTCSASCQSYGICCNGGGTGVGAGGNCAGVKCCKKKPISNNYCGANGCGNNGGGR